MDVVKNACPACKEACEQAISNSEKNPNRAYWKCGTCESMFKGWVDEGVPSVPIWAKKGGSKRVRADGESSGSSGTNFRQYDASETNSAQTRHVLADLASRVAVLERVIADASGVASTPPLPPVDG